MKEDTLWAQKICLQEEEEEETSEEAFHTLGFVRQ
jgi:hypothetical protein